MKKSTKIISEIILLLLIVSGVGYYIFRPAKVEPDKTVYKASGLSTNIKGTATKNKFISYSINDGKKHSVRIRSNSFAINIPSSNKEQKVTIYNGNVSAKIVVKASKQLADYQKFAKKYNQSLIASSLPKSIIKKANELKKAQAAKQTTAAEIARMSRTEQLQLEEKNKELKQDAKEVQAATAKLKSENKDNLLPKKLKNAIKNAVSNKNYIIRVNVANGRLIGISLIVPAKLLSSGSNKKSAQTFATTFALLANSLGANSKNVLEKFTKFAKEAKTSQTTSLKTISSKGIKFDTGFSTKKIYIFITR
ncbi:hypothetical protein [Oenococcus oeni]|nr:hypothetical protein [Oenococcus oeni]KGH69993.1 hypothetical protein X466_04870 [Oenococcus oeni S25]KGH79742.1 hypothetical protein X281_06995 [Oenococcus oeni IOEB_0607]KEK02850.1 hypothetical protein HL43_08040 [Oenococcus oeni]KER94737.1 hypothetical protein HR58_01715 [Oenococcus oeni]KER96257.1 hypothetical protein HT63_01740 [Oenococcus oeni]